jgi:hypothetical protein
MTRIPDPPLDSESAKSEMGMGMRMDPRSPANRESIGGEDDDPRLKACAEQLHLTASGQQNFKSQ